MKGPLPQTRFVLRKALEAGPATDRRHQQDRPRRTPASPEVLERGLRPVHRSRRRSEEQLDFPVLYANARDGTSAAGRPRRRDMTLEPLFEEILTRGPGTELRPRDIPLQLLVTTLDYDDYVGRLAIGRIVHGELALGQRARCAAAPDGVNRGQGRQALYGLRGAGAGADRERRAPGDIVAVAGCRRRLDRRHPGRPRRSSAAAAIQVDEPTLAMEFTINSSPMAGTDGTHVTSRKLKERLEKETWTNVSIRVEADRRSADSWSPGAASCSSRS